MGTTNQIELAQSEQVDKTLAEYNLELVKPVYFDPSADWLETWASCYEQFMYNKSQAFYSKHKDEYFGIRIVPETLNVRVSRGKKEEGKPGNFRCITLSSWEELSEELRRHTNTSQQISSRVRRFIKEKSPKETFDYETFIEWLGFDLDSIE